ncbi:MAG: c-type cytochrome [Bacteroidetes bacterium]|nr:c-type cytochrome [Bacteroidota bacterium]
MYKAIITTHLVSVILFLLIYLIKTFLLVSNNNEGLAKVTKIVKVPEMIISTLFLATGVYLLMQVGTTKLLIIKIIMVLVSIPVAIIGFKKKNKVLAILSLLLIIGAYGLAEINKKQRMKIEKQVIDTSIADTSNPNYNIVKHGEALFTAYCQSCHGVGGVKGSGGLDLTVSQTDHTTKLDRIKNGASSMPPFKDFLNEQEINAVVSYVETLKK